MHVLARAEFVRDGDVLRHDLMIEGQILVIGAPHSPSTSATSSAPAPRPSQRSHVLGLDDDFYEPLLALEAWPPERLRDLIARALAAHTLT